ncbi:MAG: carboxypeptidase regulatory-like domain-containing protein, partial [Acidobacteriota bacterium]
PEQGLRWAVLSLAGADGIPAQAETAPTLDQNGCQFIPHVVVVQAGKELTVLNSDGILHNVHTYSKENAPMNKAQPGFKKKMKVKFDQAEIVKVACDAHPWMSGWIFVSENPFATATDESGSFELAGVPPGTYELRLWHESLGEQTKQVTVKAGGETKISFELAAK